MNTIFKKLITFISILQSASTTSVMVAEPEVATSQSEAIQPQESIEVSTTIQKALGDMDMLDESSAASEFKIDMEEED